MGEMGRVSGLILVLMMACSRDPIDDTKIGSDGSTVDRQPRDVVTDVDLADGGGLLDRSIAEPPDMGASADALDTAPPGLDVGTADIALIDVIDVVGAIDASAADRATMDSCKSASYRPLSELPLVTGAAAADAADVRNDLEVRDVAIDGDAPEAGIDALCRALKAEFRAFAQQNNACSANADCMFVVGARSCDCYPPAWPGQGIGDMSGTGIAVTASIEAQMFVDRWRITGCEQWTGDCPLDLGPSNSVQCSQGKCVANIRGCLNPPPLPEPCR